MHAHLAAHAAAGATSASSPLVGALDLLATGLYGVANTEGLLSIVAVVGALYPVATVLLARVVLHERLRPSQAVGVALAFLGVAAVARRLGSGRPSASSRAGASVKAASGTIPRASASW